MNSRDKLQELLEAAARRRLTPEERSFADSELPDGIQREQLELDQALVTALDQSKPSVSSNFTSRVVQQIRLEEAAQERRHQWSPRTLLSKWLPRLAFGCLILTAGYLSYDRLSVQKRAEMARSVAMISAPSLPPAVLQDFDAIEAMSSTPTADEQLLALMQ